MQQEGRVPHVSARTVRRVRRVLGLLQAVSPRLAARVAFTLFLTPARRAFNPADAEYVSRASEFTVGAGSRTVHVYEWGAGPRTAVILHGWGSHAPRFAPLARALEAGGWRVLAIDAPGHGESPGRRSSLPEFRLALDAVLGQTGPAQALIGHSLGALAIALRLGETASAPDPGLRAAVLIATPSGAPFLIQRYLQLFAIREPTARLLRERFLERFGRAPEAFVALPGAAGIRLPVLLVHDAKDDIVPLADSEKLQAAIPGARLHVTRGLSHSGMLRDPGTIEAIMGFLAEVSG